MGILSGDHDSRVSGRPLTWRTVDLALLATCLVLVIWYAGIGYLDRPESRIRGTDSIGYYVYLPSVFIDGDIDLANNFRYLGGDDIYLFPGIENRTGNIFSVGPALFWAPWFAIGHLTAALLGYETDGYSGPYQLSVYLGNFCYVVLGVLCLPRIARSFGFTPIVALLATLSLLLATQLTYYILPKSATSHGLSFAAMGAFLLSIRQSGNTWRAGLFGGIAALIRWQNILFVPALAVVAHLDRHGPRVTAHHLRAALPFAGFVVLPLLPQIVFWQYAYGVPFLIPQRQGYLDPTRLPILQVLFSLRHGLMSWHPWWLLAIAGLLRHRQDRRWTLAVLLCLVAQVVLNAMVKDWWGNWSFGNRRFLNALPLCTVGACVVYTHFRGTVGGRFLVGTAVLLVLWNQAFVFQYQRGLIPRSESPTATEVFSDKLRLGTVWETQLAVNTAVNSFRRDDFDNYVRFAKQAHDLYPGYRNALKVHAVVAAVQGELSKAMLDYEKWLAIEPKSIAAMWGIADISLKTGQVEEARRLIRNLGVSDEETDSALSSGQGTLLTRSFFIQYLKELDQIYLQ